jgi:hypothetical protein
MSDWGTRQTTAKLSEIARGQGAGTATHEKETATAAASAARAACAEAQIYRPRLVRQNIRFEPGELQRIDDERRVPSYGVVPSRAAMIRQLIFDAILFRRANREPPRPAKGVPFKT